MAVENNPSSSGRSLATKRRAAEVAKARQVKRYEASYATHVRNEVDGNGERATAAGNVAVPENVEASTSDGSVEDVVSPPTRQRHQRMAKRTAENLITSVMKKSKNDKSTALDDDATQDVSAIAGELDSDAEVQVGPRSRAARNRKPLGQKCTLETPAVPPPSLCTTGTRGSAPADVGGDETATDEEPVPAVAASVNARLERERVAATGEVMAMLKELIHERGVARAVAKTVRSGLVAQRRVNAAVAKQMQETGVGPVQ